MIFGMRSTFNTLYFKITDFPHFELMLIRKIQKKNKKNPKNTRKIKFTKKRRSWGTKFENLATFLPINIGLLNILEEGGQLWKKNTKKKAET